MLKALLKAAGVVQEQKPVAASASMTVEVDTSEIQAMIAEAVASVGAEFETYKQAAEALRAESEVTIASLNTKLAELQASLDAATADKVAAEAAGLAAKLSSRKEKVVAAIGTDRADALMAVTEGMEDAAFDAVLSALGVSATVEAASEMFTEAGTDAVADVAAVTHEESKEMKILKAKYGDK